MKRWTKILLGIFVLFVLIVFAGAIYEVQEENEVKNAKTIPYSVVKFWSSPHAGLKRYAENILAKTSDKSQITLIAKKEILRLKNEYGADVVWGSADIVFYRHTSALGHINLNSLWVHRE